MDETLESPLALFDADQNGLGGSIYLSAFITRLAQPKCRVSINNQSVYESRPQQPLHGLKLLPARAKQYDLPLEEVLEINGECSLIYVALHDLPIRIEKLAKAIANGPRPLKILELNSRQVTLLKQQAVFVAWFKGCHVETGLLREGERLLENSLRHEDLPIRYCVRNKWHRQKVPLTAGSFCKLINDFEKICCGCSRKRARRRYKLRAGLRHAHEVIRNFCHGSPPADTNNAVLISLKPLTQQLRGNHADRAPGNRTFHLELRTRRKGFPPAWRIGRQGRRGAAERKIVTAPNVLFNIHHPGKAVLNRDLDNPSLSGLRQESVYLYARNS